jgi:hypothetical protein
MIFCLLLVISNVQANVIRPAFGVGHEEALMASTGMARTGSTGATITNPSLLTDHIEDEVFTSTNVITFFNFKDSNADVSPTIMPLLAGTTYREGNWGRGYSFSTQEIRSNFSQNEDVRFSGQSSVTTIHLNGSLAYRLGNLSLGATLGLSREAGESRLSYFAQSGGNDFIGSSVQSSEVFSSDLRLGMNYKVNEKFVLAAVVGTPVAVFKSDEKSQESVYSTFDNSYTETSSSRSIKVFRQQVGGVGVAYAFDTARLYLDYAYESEVKGESGIAQYGVSALRVGIEKKLEKVTLYAGSTLNEAYRSAEDADSKANMTVASGFSLKHRYAQSMYGVLWQRPVEGSGNEFYGITFGTKFIY